MADNFDNKVNINDEYGPDLVSVVDEDGVEREGYVAKRNLKLLEEDSEEETIDENTEPQE